MLKAQVWFVPIAEAESAASTDKGDKQGGSSAGSLRSGGGRLTAVNAYKQAREAAMRAPAGMHVAAVAL